MEPSGKDPKQAGQGKRPRRNSVDRSASGNYSTGTGQHYTFTGQQGLLQLGEARDSTWK